MTIQAFFWTCPSQVQHSLSAQDHKLILDHKQRGIIRQIMFPPKVSKRSRERQKRNLNGQLIPLACAGRHERMLFKSSEENKENRRAEE